MYILYIVLLGLIIISNARSKRVNKNIMNAAHSMNEIFIYANFHVCFSFYFHYYALCGLITISNIRSKRVSKNIKI